jgi:exodeoxyribonuclease VII large subunit
LDEIFYIPVTTRSGWDHSKSPVHISGREFILLFWLSNFRALQVCRNFSRDTIPSRSPFAESWKSNALQNQSLTSSPKLGILLSMQPTLFSTQQWTVSRLTFYIRKLLEENEILQDVWVQGEISNLSRPASGHVYFTLKDPSAALKCVMWKTSAARLGIALQDGMAVEVHGKIGVYEVSGQYQLYADQIRPVGEGALYQEFMRLKAMLEAEGLFDPERKRPIPMFPQTIGIVTSATGAALRDMLNTLRRRLPLVQVILAPAPVQGTEAPPALVKAIRSLNAQTPDVILLARGGGSIEDLWAFNDERVVRAVAASGAPVICGVGHETDFTLCDFAADLRAPTPTAAAELATQITMLDLRAAVQNYKTRILTATLNLLAEQKTALSSLVSQLRYVSPDRRIQSERQRVDELARRAHSSLFHHIQLQSAHVKGMERRLAALNPLAVLRRGYAVVTRKEDGSVVSRLAQASEEMNVRVSDGEFEVRKSTSR